MLRLSAVVTSALLATGLLTVVATSEVTAASAAPPPPAITWKTCSDADLASRDLQCGSLQVPLDAAKPTGAKVTLALTRRLHTTSTYRGVMLTNPGGPGGSGLTLPVLADYVPGGVGASYDWIGFDPRGVGASTPSLHCSTRYFGYNRPNYTPKNKRITRYWLTKASRFATSCADTATKRALLAHITTLDSVRDMDAIRNALGADKLNYYGFSYGTYLGQVYATRYPSRVGRFVLDGVVNPTRVWYGANLDQDRAFDKNMNVYWHYLAAHPGAFKLGKKWKAIKRGYYRELKRLDKHPAAGGKLGPDELGDALLSAGYYVYDWVDIGMAYSDLIRHHRGGELLADYAGSNVGSDNENGFAIYNGVQCSDVTWPGWKQTRKDSTRVARKAPFLTWGNTWYNAPCLTWHAPHHARLGVSGSGLASKILLISETKDAATPFSGALAVRRLFPSASLIAGVGGTTHASSLSGVGCVDNAVASYLTSGTVPTRLSGTRADRNCPRLAPPQPVSSTSRESGTTSRMDPLVRNALLAAQHSSLG